MAVCMCSSVSSVHDGVIYKSVPSSYRATATSSFRTIC